MDISHTYFLGFDSLKRVKTILTPQTWLLFKIPAEHIEKYHQLKCLERNILHFEHLLHRKYNF